MQAVGSLIALLQNIQGFLMGRRNKQAAQGTQNSMDLIESSSSA